MQAHSFRREEKIGLVVAFGLHAALVLVLLFRPSFGDDFEPFERMTVSLASDVSLESTAPEPVEESRAAIAPELADEPAPAPEADTPPAPQQPDPRRERPAAQQREAPPPSRRSGGSLIGDNFLAGAGGSTDTEESRAPASQIGARVKASLFQAVARELKPHWRPPSGPDVEAIITRVRFRLNPDGTLAGRPRVIGQSGINPLNRMQAGRHAEQAVRAVELAAPFDLPERFYEAWELITVDFDWKLSQ